MKGQTKGSCTHIKGTYDNHPTCLKCSGCTMESTCEICASWPSDVWAKAQKRRAYASRKKSKSGGSTCSDSSRMDSRPPSPNEGRSHRSPDRLSTHSQCPGTHFVSSVNVIPSSVQLDQTIDRLDRLNSGIDRSFSTDDRLNSIIDRPGISIDRPPGQSIDRLPGQTIDRLSGQSIDRLSGQSFDRPSYSRSNIVTSKDVELESLRRSSFTATKITNPDELRRIQSSSDRLPEFDRLDRNQYSDRLDRFKTGHHVDRVDRHEPLDRLDRVEGFERVQANSRSRLERFLLEEELRTARERELLVSSLLRETTPPENTNRTIPLHGFDWPVNQNKTRSNHSDSPASQQLELSPTRDTQPNTRGIVDPSTSHQKNDVLSLHPSDNDPLYKETRESHTPPCFKTGQKEEHTQHKDHQTETANSEDLDWETPPSFSFSKAINEVFRYLPEDRCPRTPTPKSNRFMGFADPEESDSQEEVFHLPMASSIKELATFLDEDLKKRVDSLPWVPPSSVLTKGFKYHPAKYLFSSQPFPTSVPQLDEDASRLNIKPCTNLSIPTKQIDRWEGRVRQLLGVSSHSNAFAAALQMALKSSEELDPASISLLIEALLRTTNHMMGISLSVAAEMFKARREGHIPTGNQISENSKRTLRSAPISADTLFGGKIAKVAEAEQNDRLRDAAVSVRAPKQTFKRPFPKQKGGGHSHFSG